MRPQGPFTQEPALNAASEAFIGKDAITKIKFPVSSSHLIDWTQSTLVTTSRVCKSCGEGDLKGHFICTKCNDDFGTRNPGTYRQLRPWFSPLLCRAEASSAGNETSKKARKSILEHDDAAYCRRQASVFNVAQCDFRHSKIGTQGRYTVRINTQAERDEIIKDTNQRLNNLETNQTNQRLTNLESIISQPQVFRPV